jgi:thioredoxin-like negative regulator of GroEL
VPTFAFAVVLQASLLATSSENASYNYADAYKATEESGKPLVVLVGAEWCPGCQAMKTSIMPKVAAHGGLKNVAYAQVNTDRQGELARQMMSGNMIPQLVMYTKTADGWKRQRLIGAQSPEAVESFLNSAAEATHTVSAVASH